MNVNFVDEKGRTALAKASSSGNVKQVEFLLSLGALPDIADNENYTPLMRAAKGGTKNHEKIVGMLLDHCLTETITFRHENNAFLCACKGGNVKIVSMILSHGDYIDSIDEYGNTGLIIAAKNFDLELIKHLVRLGADVFIQNFKGQTAASILHEEYISRTDVVINANELDYIYDILTKEYDEDILMVAKAA